MPTALLVEDDPAALSALTSLVEGFGFSTISAGSWSEARTELLRQNLDVVLLDVFLPGGSGLDLLLEIPKQRRPRVILMSGDDSVAKAFSGVAMQELHFLQKPIEVIQLARTLEGVRRQCSRREPEPKPQRRSGLERLQGSSAAMCQLRALVAKVAPLDMSVYVEGESGTGKELVALAIHESSARSAKAFVALNCGALPEQLIDSQLFGHEKGSFTGADKQKAGVFEQADGGTLFLDEIAEMPIELQARLLRALETHSFRRVGGTRDIQVDVRIVAATNRSFDRAIAEGRFREDLFHRLCVFPIVTPPLRERPEDIEPLARIFLAELCAEHGQAKEFEAGLLTSLNNYSWPGNVRQLRNAIQRAYVVADGAISAACLPAQVLQGSVLQSVRPANSDHLELQIGTSIAQAERRLIEATLQRASGDKRVAADMLGVSLRTLYNRLNQYTDGGGTPAD